MNGYEIKGINGGLKREHINQVDSHRERLGLPTEIPGLLILNDFSDINGLQERKAKRFDQVHLGHADKLNIRILRTTTLLEIVVALRRKGIVGRSCCSYVRVAHLWLNCRRLETS